MVVFVERGDVTASVREVAFILADAPDLATLMDGLRPEVTPVIVDAFGDGLSTITRALAGYRDLTAIHIVSHGAPGLVHLGRLDLDAEALAVRAADMTAIGAALADDGEVLLYGCDVARGAEGRAFVEAFADAVCANVSASDDPTGDLTRGGDWELEFVSGVRTVASAFTAETMASYAGLLGAIAFDYSGYTMSFFNTKEYAGPTVTDGELGSMQMMEKDIVISTSGPEADWYYEPELNGIRSNTFDNTITIKSADGSEFTFRGFAASDFEGQTQVKVEGFRDGVSTGSITLGVHGDVNSYFAEDDAAPFINVDEVRLTNPSGMMSLAFSELRFDSPVGGQPQDTQQPIVAEATTPSNDTYGEGDYLDFKVKFDEAVYVTSGNSSPSMPPYVKLTIGEQNVQAEYYSGDGTDTLTFRYKVGEGDLDNDGVTVGDKILLGSGTIKDAAGNDAKISNISFGATSGVLVDATGFKVESIKIVGDEVTNASELSFKVSFNKAASMVDTGDFELHSYGEASGVIDSVTEISPSTYEVKVKSVTGDGDLRLDVKSDASILGPNDTKFSGGYTLGESYDVDNTAPDKPLLKLDANSDSGELGDKITNVTQPTFKISTSEVTAVKIYEGLTYLGDAVAGGGNKESTGIHMMASGETWTFTPSQPLTEGQHEFTAVGFDTVGNKTTSDLLKINIDTHGPTVAITAGATSLLANETTKVTFTFNEAPVGFDVEDVQVEGGKIVDLAVTSNPKVFEATLKPYGESVSSTVAYNKAIISLEGKSFTDAAGNTGSSAQELKISTNNKAPEPPVVTPPSPPVTQSVDGVNVGKTTTTGTDGTINQTITVPVVTEGRAETVGGNKVADIPLVTGAGGVNLLAVQVPTGAGLTISGYTAPKAAGSSLDDLIREIKAHTAAGSSDQTILTGGGSGFLAALPTTTPLIVQTIVPTGSINFNAPLIITSPVPSSVATAALVIDTRNLVGGATLQLQNVEFAAVIGAATITGGEGSQHVFGDGAAQTFFLGADDDELHGGAGDDTVGSAGGNDQLTGDDGNDSVYGGIGDDYVHGNAGADTVHGDEGNDIAQGGQGDDQVFGGDGADMVLGDYGNDYVQGNAGNDTVNGGAGYDTVHGGQGDDVVMGGEEADFVSGDAGNDYVQGNTGNDTLEGGAGNDLLHGGKGEDVLRGGDGNDILSGDFGNDILTGGSGADRFAFQAGHGIDLITDFSKAEGDKLQITFTPGHGYQSVSEILSHVTADASGHAVVNLGEGATITLVGVGVSQVTADIFA